VTGSILANYWSKRPAKPRGSDSLLEKPIDEPH
jgi:hypothetical protein